MTADRQTDQKHVKIKYRPRQQSTVSDHCLEIRRGSMTLGAALPKQ
jgi:hypothetical protein